MKKNLNNDHISLKHVWKSFVSGIYSWLKYKLWSPGSAYYNFASRKKKEYRIAAKNILLTYSQVNHELTNELVLECLQNVLKDKIKNYIIAKEYHQDEGVHFHALLSAPIKFDFNTELVSLPFKETVYKGHYSPVTNYPQMVKYVCKKGEYIHNLTDILKNYEKPYHEELIENVTEGGVNAGLTYSLRKHPEKALRPGSLSATESNIQCMLTLPQFAKSEPPIPFTRDIFNSPPELDEWVADGCRPTLILVGPPGVGKTVWIKILKEEKSWKMLKINHMEGFKDLTDQHTAIVLDDFAFTSISRNEFLALVENTADMNIRVCYGSVKKKMNMIQAFICNYETFFEILDYLKLGQVSRRVRIVELPDNFMKNVSITNNVMINNHTYIHNNPEAIERNYQKIDEIEKRDPRVNNKKSKKKVKQKC